MLVVTGIFENERFIPDKPVSIPQNKKVIVTIEELTAEASSTEKPVETRLPVLSMAQIEEWSKAPEIQSLVGVLKDANLPPDIKIGDIRNMRLEEKYQI
jgi:hypothetical protein